MFQLQGMVKSPTTKTKPLTWHWPLVETLRSRQQAG
jgi:hypothetical protein